MNKGLKFGCLVPAALLAAGLLGLAGWIRISVATSDPKCPELTVRPADYPLSVDTDSVRRCRDHVLLCNPYGVWEARISGSAEERGMAMGAMGRDLLRFQEEVFVRQIRQLVPSERYLRLLDKLTLFFNRRLADYIPEEYRREIAALSECCSHDFDEFGSPYVRQLNYHAAHDIGHAMQKYMLVGCSAFAVRNGCSADSTLLVGRNFDFYVGDDFARNKLVSFVAPDRGYRYASVGWPGMIGVLSGMNERGLTVTLNAAEGPIPASSAMPVSLLARHMLQYAATLDEARAIADTCRTFVSESFVVTAACGRRAAVIEKTPERQALFVPEGDVLLCTNHYQSAAFADDPVNRANIADSDSEYRRRRLAELLAERAPLDPAGAVAILRDRRGLGGRDIGLTNEKSIDQCLAHHSVVFQPEHGLMWVSTGPWQAGAYLCYDLKRIFGGADPTPAGFADAARTIAADSEFLQHDYLRVCDYRRRAAVVRHALESGQELSAGYADSLVAANPEYFESHALQGDYFYERKDCGRAIRSWRQALDCEIPRRGQREELERKITRYDKKQ